MDTPTIPPHMPIITQARSFLIKTRRDKLPGAMIVERIAIIIKNIVPIISPWSNPLIPASLAPITLPMNTLMMRITIEVIGRSDSDNGVKWKTRDETSISNNAVSKEEITPRLTGRPHKKVEFTKLCTPLP